MRSRYWPLLGSGLVGVTQWLLGHFPAPPQLRAAELDAVRPFVTRNLPIANSRRTHSLFTKALRLSGGTLARAAATPG